MTRKDYQVIASAIRSAGLPPLYHNIIVALLVKAFERNNARFDAHKFVMACNG